MSVQKNTWHNGYGIPYKTSRFLFQQGENALSLITPHSSAQLFCGVMGALVIRNQTMCHVFDIENYLTRKKIKDNLEPMFGTTIAGIFSHPFIINNIITPTLSDATVSSAKSMANTVFFTALPVCFMLCNGVSRLSHYFTKNPPATTEVKEITCDDTDNDFCLVTLAKVPNPYKTHA